MHTIYLNVKLYKLLLFIVPKSPFSFTVAAKLLMRVVTTAFYCRLVLYRVKIILNRFNDLRSSG